MSGEQVGGSAGVASPSAPADQDAQARRAERFHIVGGETVDARGAADALVTYHKPNDLSVAKIGLLRDAAGLFIRVVLENCPAGADRSAAVRKIREGLMSANAAVVVPAVRI